MQTHEHFLLNYKVQEKANKAAAEVPSAGQEKIRHISCQLHSRLMGKDWFSKANR